MRTSTGFKIDDYALGRRTTLGGQLHNLAMKRFRSRDESGDAGKRLISFMSTPKFK